MSLFGLGIKSIKLLILISIIAGVGFLLLNIFNTSSSSPQAVTETFISLTKNPTDVISKNEKNTLNKITEQNFLKNIQHESLIKEIRNIHKQYPRSDYRLEVDEQTPYSIASIKYYDLKDNTVVEIKLFMESYKPAFYLPEETKIFHIEIIGIKSQIDQELTKTLEKNVETIKDKIDEGLENLNTKLKLNF